MSPSQLPSSPTGSVHRLLKTARDPGLQSSAPTLHERRIQGLEAAERLKDRPKPR